MSDKKSKQEQQEEIKRWGEKDPSLFGYIEAFHAFVCSSHFTATQLRVISQSRRVQQLQGMGLVYKQINSICHQNRRLLLLGGFSVNVVDKLFSYTNRRHFFRNMMLKFMSSIISRRNKIPKLTCVATQNVNIAITCSIAFDSDGILLVNDMSSIKVATLDNHTSCVICVAFDKTHDLFATGSFDMTAKLWRRSPDKSSAICLATLAGHTNVINSVKFHPDHPFFLTGSWDNTAKLWKLSYDTSPETCVPTCVATCVATLKGHDRMVWDVAFHPTELVLATVSDDKTAKLWRFSPNGSEVTYVATLAGHTEGVTSVAFDPTGRFLATGSKDKTMKLWCILPYTPSVTCVATLEGHDRMVYSVAFHSTAPLLVTGSKDKTVKVWWIGPNGSTVTCVATLAGHTDCVSSVIFDLTGRFLVTGSDDKTVKSWR